MVNKTVSILIQYVYAIMKTDKVRDEKFSITVSN